MLMPTMTLLLSVGRVLFHTCHSKSSGKESDDNHLTKTIRNRVARTAAGDNLEVVRQQEDAGVVSVRARAQADGSKVGPVLSPEKMKSAMEDGGYWLMGITRNTVR